MKQRQVQNLRKLKKRTATTVEPIWHTREVGDLKYTRRGEGTIRDRWERLGEKGGRNKPAQWA